MTHSDHGSAFTLHVARDLLPEAPIALSYPGEKPVLTAYPAVNGKPARLDIEVAGGRVTIRSGRHGDSFEFRRLGAVAWDPTRSPWGGGLTDAVCEFGARLSLFLAPRLDALHAVAESAAVAYARGGSSWGSPRDGEAVQVAWETLERGRARLGPISAASIIFTDALLDACAGRGVPLALEAAA